jgi:hypothetical protein
MTNQNVSSPVQEERVIAGATHGLLSGFLAVAGPTTAVASYQASSGQDFLVTALGAAVGLNAMGLSYNSARKGVNHSPANAKIGVVVGAAGTSYLIFNKFWPVVEPWLR